MGVPRLNSSVGCCSSCSVVISIVHEQEVVRGLVLELAWGPQQRNKGTKRPQSKFRESWLSGQLPFQRHTESWLSAEQGEMG